MWSYIKRKSILHNIKLNFKTKNIVIKINYSVYLAGLIRELRPAKEYWPSIAGYSEFFKRRQLSKGFMR